MGFRTEIECDNGSKQICSIGTRWCYDNSPQYCAEKQQFAQKQMPILGAPTEVNCFGYSTTWCAGGTWGCVEDGPACYAIFDTEFKEISCRDGTKKHCEVGSADCVDNSKLLCDSNSRAGVAKVECMDGSSRYCYLGTQYCGDQRICSAIDPRDL